MEVVWSVWSSVPPEETIHIPQGTITPFKHHQQQEVQIQAHLSLV